MVSRIRCRVRKERAFGMPIERLRNIVVNRRSDSDVIAEFADKAGVDWLYQPSTGEVRFFDIA